MAGKNSDGRLPEFREFVSENDQRLHDFCFYMLGGTSSAEDVVLAVFADFGWRFRRLASRKRSGWSPRELRILLFREAWRKVRDTVDQARYSPLNIGRDTRGVRRFDEDLLEAWSKKARSPSDMVESVVERLNHVEADFRGPLTLKDLLGFEDEEVVQILEIRWGVYRHRLHRGRLELAERLRGRLAKPEASEAHPER